LIAVPAARALCAELLEAVVLVFADVFACVSVLAGVCDVELVDVEL
jgi:hypothetical protein